MTTTKTFHCNLCRDRITETSGVGVQFVSSSKLEQVPVPMAETHVCNACLVQLAQFKTDERRMMAGLV